MTRSSPRRLWWLMVAGAASYFALFAFYPRLFLRVGVNYFGVWFLDTFAILASNEAVARGMNPYLPNPLDYLQRPHVYSHWWLELHRLGLNRSDTLWLGLVLVVGFFIAATVNLRPRSAGELLWYLAVLCSSPVLLAIHRANNDLVIFLLLLPVVPCLLDQRRFVRFCPILLIAVATGLKFYPAIAGMILLAGVGAAREKRFQIAIALLLLAMVGLNIAPDVVRMGAVVPKAEGLMTFGLGNLLEPLGLDRWKLVVAVGGAALVVAAFFRSSIFDDGGIVTANRADWLRFILGAALLTGCYLTGSNYAYRWVFAIWMAPLLWHVARDPSGRAGLRRLAVLTAALLLVSVWADAGAGMVLSQMMGKVYGPTIEQWANRFFLWEQPFTAAFFVCLLGWLGYFLKVELRAFFQAEET